VALSEWEVVKKLRRNPRFLIGADGHRSRVRATLGIDFDTVAPPEVFAVFEFACDWPAQNELRVVLTETTANVLWPFPDGRCRWSFQLEDGATRLRDPRYKSRYAYQVGRESFPHLSERLLGEMIAERAPWFDAKPGEVFWSAGVRFERRIASRFGRGRAWLAGDSGHLTGPAGIQSMNVGLREARDLAACIAGVLPDGAPGDTLAVYDRERLREWKSLLGLESGVTANEHADDWVARNCDRIVPCIPASGAELSALLGQIGLELPDRTHAPA
jgi:2-polyprenyl-6-methoxyphenol hydroxylase-like FAD-dependent oxidoreductase